MKKILLSLSGLLFATSLASSAAIAEDMNAPESAEPADSAPSPPVNNPSKRGETCSFSNPGVLTLKPDEYFRCDIDAKELVITGKGNFNFGDSAITAQLITFAADGRVDLSVSDIRADKIVVKRDAQMVLLGANVFAKTICGYMRAAEASGMTMVAEDQISLNLINASLQGSQIKTEIFGPGPMDNAQLYPGGSIDCRENLSDFSVFNEGNCPRPEKGSRKYLCD